MSTAMDSEARAAVVSTMVVVAICTVLALKLAVAAYGGILEACSLPVRIAGAASVFGSMFVLANAVLFRPVAFVVVRLYLPFASARR